MFSPHRRLRDRRIGTVLTAALNRSGPVAPRVSTTLAVGTALVLSTIPSLLPRPAPIQGLLSTVLVLLALAALALARLATTLPWARLVPSARRSSGATAAAATWSDSTGRPVRARWAALAAASAAVLGVTWLAHLHLTAQAAYLGLPATSATYWLTAAGWGLLLLGLAAILLHGVRLLARLTRRHRPVLLTTALLAGVAVTTAAAGPVDLVAPLRKTLDPNHVLLTESPAGASRSFALVTEVESPEDGARLAVDRMVADGGLDRSAILIALPTGSGWVNPEAVTAIEAQLDGDLAVVSAQYGDLPSWWSFLLDQEPAMRSARALVGEVRSRVAALPADRRPDIYLHGESLGAQAGQEAISGLDEEDVCGVLWSGAPGGVLSGHPRERSLHNSDDPVGYLRLDTAAAEPEGWPTVWLPGLSYGTTVLDLWASLSPSHGHGHVYGPEQNWTLPTC